MKNLLLLCCLLTIASLATGQKKEYSCTISRKDYSKFHVTSSDRDSILLSKDSIGDRILQSDLYYKIIKGKGGKKDTFGIKERHKRYLISSQSDTLLTIRDNYKLILTPNLNSIKREYTPYGWKYVDEESNTICELHLLWNNSYWNYTIKYFKEGDDVEALNKFIMLNLVRLAYNRSKCNCDSGDDNFWFLMWAASQK
ncbi:MAG: hypothetical protein ACEPOZ_03575 [Marinifilaceae bacterium]|jgi:hypothetical protein